MRRRKWIICLAALAACVAFCGCGQGSTIAAAEPLVLQAEAAMPAEPEKRESTEPLGEKESIIEYAAPLAYVLEYPRMANEEINNQILEFVEGLKAEFAEKYDIKDEKAKRRLTQNDCDKFLYLDYDSYIVSEDKVCIVFFETQELGENILPVEQVEIFHFDINTGQRIDEKDIRKDGFLEAASAYTIEYFTTHAPYKDRIFGDYKTTLAPEGGRFEHFALNSEGVLFYFHRYDVFPGSLGRVDLFIPYSELAGLLNGVGIEAPPVVEKDEAQPIQPVTKPEREIDPNKPMVALTFDDGPNPIQTGRILDALEENGVVATFFDLGKLVEAYPETVQRELALGCEVGSHSYSHKNFNTLSAKAIAEDVAKTAEAFRKTTGAEPTLFRPPYGNCNDFVKANIPLSMVTWSVDTLDWKSKNADAIMNVIRSEGSLDGKVILMHGIYETSAAATERLIPYLLERGYQLVTVSEILEYKHGVQPENGKFYGYSYFQ
ncbi:peptidoglycan-N-acetylmuramic acid deacetylase PdaC [Anaerotignum neopropionicum]|uniref:Peptidoglycan-N-acetylmuramic acid deacetylase PdaC n=1 Tax=Anaerotignum neopropionicum TaxID=36847 RepID=A0A136WBY9_9FIRM|nr:polysaccharide deacetylase family protein [Anaerotignum neopropionicum]KXL52031.1 peptidoglycan-N-acetylmuramic acid deacetylase PdaC [Anaerotignum neopropionicum]